MKPMKKFIALFSAFALTIALAGCAGGTAVRSSLSYRNFVQSSLPESWSITADTVRGHTTRDVDITAEQLVALEISGSIGGGEVRLAISQGNESIVIGLAASDTEETAAYHGALGPDHGFEPGPVSLRLEFVQVENLSIHISWEVGFNE